MSGGGKEEGVGARRHGKAYRQYHGTNKPATHRRQQPRTPSNGQVGINVVVRMDSLTPVM
ncbi:hypothetical protein CHS0354_016868, partial [Potamilus streckersoni]